MIGSCDSSDRSTALHLAVRMEWALFVLFCFAPSFDKLLKNEFGQFPSIWKCLNWITVLHHTHRLRAADWTVRHINRFVYELQQSMFDQHCNALRYTANFFHSDVVFFYFLFVCAASELLGDTVVLGFYANQNTHHTNSNVHTHACCLRTSFILFQLAVFALTLSIVEMKNAFAPHT